MQESTNSRQRSLRRPRRWLRGTLLIASLAVGAILPMFWLERQMVFVGAGDTSGDWQPAEFEYRDIFFDSLDGTRLHGWLLTHPQPEAALVVVHGNGENVARMGRYLDELRNRYRVTVFAFDYRGYGKSDGSCSEEGVMMDGIAAQSWLAEHLQIDTAEVVVLGRSLGGAIAVHAAAELGAKGLVLERTFSSLPDVAARLLPWFPVRWFMWMKMNSVEKLADYRGPLLQSHGTTDQVVPYQLGEQLFAVCPSQQKRFVSMPGVGHNDPGSTEYEHALEEFLWNLD